MDHSCTSHELGMNREIEAKSHSKKEMKGLGFGEPTNVPIKIDYRSRDLCHDYDCGGFYEDAKTTMVAGEARVGGAGTTVVDGMVVEGNY
ncbi:uncharacterized protein HKW66_Vig0204600 [Vigna angularis]|uniref:Uncharacterized protein n=1 Tax=Phaseolus angularis TaxID=3914 RepID=A0A8T0JVB2_PHAAN|nr:uncharacterized protein HKW66_Vig0204600 [Vigna angularis]